MFILRAKRKAWSSKRLQKGQDIREPQSQEPCIRHLGTYVTSCCVCSLVGSVWWEYTMKTEKIWKVWPHLSLSLEGVSQGHSHSQCRAPQLPFKVVYLFLPRWLFTWVSFLLKCQVALVSSVFHSSLVIGTTELGVEPVCTPGRSLWFSRQWLEE